jgi:hypothetical protein
MAGLPAARNPSVIPTAFDTALTALEMMISNSQKGYMGIADAMEAFKLGYVSADELSDVVGDVMLDVLGNVRDISGKWMGGRQMPSQALYAPYTR